MKRFFVLAILVGFLLASIAPPVLAVINSLNGMTGTAEIDARAFGVKCDGSTNDKPAFDKAYDSLTTTGGTIVVPYTGSACMIDSDVAVESNVKLRCEPGATLKWTAAPTVTLAMFSWFITKDRTEVRDCVFDLNGQPKSAVWISGSQNVFANNKIQNGDTSNGTNWAMAYFGGGGEVKNNVVACANTSGAKDIGFQVNISSAGAGGVFSGNTITNCDAIGVQSQNSTTVIGNYVSTIGSAASGIATDGAAGRVISNYVTGSGASNVGIYSTTTSGAIAENYIVNTGTTGTGIYASGGTTKIIGNTLAMSASTAGTEAQIGIDALGLGTRIIGNTSVFSVDEDNWHIRTGAQQVRVMGNYLLNGKYGVAPNNNAASTEEINCYVIGNEIWGIAGTGSIAVVGITGWFVDSNYIAWNEYDGISVGDARGTIKAGTSHTKISANRIHSANSTGQGIVFAPLAKLCDSGTKQNQTCTLDTTDPTNGCPYGTCPNCCDLSTLSQVTIVGNEFLFAGTDPIIDIAAAITGSGSAPVKNVIIDGSVVSMGASQDFVAFPSSNQSLVTLVTIGDFSYTGNTTGVLPISNLTVAQGTLTSYPPIVADLPAASCIGTTSASFWNTPSSNAPAAACWDLTNYDRGVLDFDKATDETVFTDLVLPPVWTGRIFADVWWTTTDTTAARAAVWAIEAVCVADTEGEDPAFSSTANSVTASNETDSASDIAKDTITLSNAANNPLNTCAAGEVMHLKFYRDANNGSDTVDADARLLRVTLRQW